MVVLSDPALWGTIARSRRTLNHSPQLTANEPTFFNLRSKSLAVLVLPDVEAGDIDSVGCSSGTPPMIGAAECGKRGVSSCTVLVNDVAGACCSGCSGRELAIPAGVGLLGPSPPPLFFFFFDLPLLAAAAAATLPIPNPGLRTRRAWITGLLRTPPLDVSESRPCVETEVPREAMLDDRDPAAFGSVTRSTSELVDGTTVSGPPTWACICACEWSMGDRGTRPRPRFDADVDTDRDFDEEAEDAWSTVFVIEERCLLWRLNGRRALTLTILLLAVY